MWEDNIKMNIGVTGLEDVDWIRMVQDRDRALVDTLVNFRVP
jgi:hypothetical protein